MTPTSSAPRSRQRLSEDQRRKQIMEAAVLEVADRGYEGASLTRIAKRAGVAKGLIWHYFTDKDDLMESTAKRTMRVMHRHVVDMLDLGEPVPDIIRAAVRVAAGQIRTHRDELIALNRIIHNLHSPDGTEQVTVDFYSELYRAQEDLFRRGQAEGSLGDFDPTVMAVTYQGSIDMMLMYFRDHPEVDPYDYADKLAEILLGGMRAKR
ncbi:TetR family transcriptional regulator [Spiractinospora alimapuensis]|uniref:TetR/AcrR family transcriptional regulator n=1 Tax=Spiractinospora alimapuensis TaxID=2820884 RepID=UPI001F461BC2|nr:TetR/AcrR family transcriptional regulator [Spiractinospora alimapuensis]QVQ53777.1 TetR family transcriptional regulator [Spiractinospora alimapuensis]